VSLCDLCGEGLGLAFQFPDYQITQLPNPNHSITKSRAPQIPVIPIWRRLQQLPQQIALFFSVSPCLRGGCSVFQLPDYPITQLPNLGGLPLRSQSSQFGVDFSNFQVNRVVFLRVSAPPWWGFWSCFPISRLPNYPITKSKSLNYQISGGVPLRSQSSQFGVDFGKFQSKSRCFSPCLPSVVGVRFFNYTITKLPNYPITVSVPPWWVFGFAASLCPMSHAEATNLKFREPSSH
jgi:hypothetical protein